MRNSPPVSIAAPRAWARSAWHRIRTNPRLSTAVATGLVLRSAFAVVATPSGYYPGSDPDQFLSYASSISQLAEYQMRGHVTAYFPAGWPLMLSPVAWLSRHTGGFSLPLGANLLCAALGGYIVWATARLAAIWFGRRVGVVTAWLVAVAPALIVVSATPLVETCFTAVVMTLLIPVSELLQAERFTPPSRRRVFAWGVLAGYLIVVRSSGVVVLLVVAACVWHAAGSFAVIRRTVGLVALGMMVLVVPMTLRNGLALHFWSPFSTNQAQALCQAHNDAATGGYSNDRTFLETCSWAPRPDSKWDSRTEGAWANSVPRKAATWALHHPRRELLLARHKLYIVLLQDREAGALSYTEESHAIPDRYIDPLWTAIETWRTIALTLAAVALVRSRRCRRAHLLWIMPVALVAVLMIGPVGARMNLPLLPFLAIFSATVVLPDRPDEGRNLDGGDPGGHHVPPPHDPAQVILADAAVPG